MGRTWSVGVEHNVVKIVEQSAYLVFLLADCGVDSRVFAAKPVLVHWCFIRSAVFIVCFDISHLCFGDKAPIHHKTGYFMEGSRIGFRNRRNRPRTVRDLPRYAVSPIPWVGRSLLPADLNAF